MAGKAQGVPEQSMRTRTPKRPTTRPIATTRAHHEPQTRMGRPSVKLHQHKACCRKQSSTATQHASDHDAAAMCAATISPERAGSRPHLRPVDGDEETNRSERDGRPAASAMLSSFASFVSSAKLVAPRALIIFVKAEGPTRQLCPLRRSTRELW